MRYPVLIFDLDDTLIESFPQYVALHRRIAGDIGWRVPEAPELVHYGPTWKDTLGRLWPERSLQPFMDRYDELADDHAYPAIAGVPGVLHQLRERGHSLWIVTKRSRLRLHQRMHQAQLPPPLFEGIFAFEDQPAAKPDPRCFDPVWDALGRRDPDAAIYVGDREDDHIAARAAGVEFVGVRTGPENLAGSSMQSFLEQLPPGSVLDTAAELPDWLEENR